MNNCRGCGAPLTEDKQIFADGCPCNSPRGINHGLVPEHVCACSGCYAKQVYKVSKEEPKKIKFREFL